MVLAFDNISQLEEIVQKFDEYDFVILLHGKQSYSLFDTIIPNGVRFDNVIERNIYYN